MEMTFQFKDHRGIGKFVLVFEEKSGVYYRYLNGKEPTLTYLVLALTALVNESKMLPKRRIMEHQVFKLLPNCGLDIRYIPKLYCPQIDCVFELPFVVDGDEILGYEFFLPIGIVLGLTPTMVRGIDVMHMSTENRDSDTPKMGSWLVALA